MLSNIKMPKSKFNIILIFTSMIIFSISMEAMIRVKDISLFQNWIEAKDILINNEIELEEAFNSYLVLILISMFIKIVVPMALSIHSYFAYTRIRINKLFIFIWIVLLLGGLAYELVGLNIGSIFFYINIIIYIVLIITIFSLNSVIDLQRGD